MMITVSCNVDLCDPWDPIDRTTTLHLDQTILVCKSDDGRKAETCCIVD